MKIVVLLFASYFGFGLAMNETVRVHEPANVAASYNTPSNASVEQPVMDVLLDTVEVTAEAPVAVVLK
ncbi:hypothetical protein GCM10023188_38430 [Pontibacter saemangeumensis]|uniref:Uncharacterized protein n=1 Tax=Pontibacter saemangeumensis TaxID=1084525 RepID=A0ABP8M234_9BACT